MTDSWLSKEESNMINNNWLEGVIDDWLEIERWFAEHDRLRKLIRMRNATPKTCEGYGKVKIDPL